MSLRQCVMFYDIEGDSMNIQLTQKRLIGKDRCSTLDNFLDFFRRETDRRRPSGMREV